MTATALTIPFERIADPAVRAIAEKVAAGTRLTQADGVALFESADLTGVAPNTATW
jgi:2-iminoacetate synthase ThiH